MITIQHILVPTDFSEPSNAAVKYGRAFAESFRSTLHVLHVVDDFLINWPANEGTAIIPPPALDDLEDRARQQMAQVLSPEDTDRFHARLMVIRGSASAEITNYALAEKIDLIVLGTHGRSPIAHMLMGSVAEKVVRKAPCPVLVVRHPEHDFVVP
jgi:nucleotide-binding universal stress UspA family protein